MLKYINSDIASTIVVINGLAITAGSKPSFLVIIGREQPTILAIAIVNTNVELQRQIGNLYYNKWNNKMKNYFKKFHFIHKINNRKRTEDLETVIEVDGGINLATCEKVKKAGAEILVAGTAILMATDYKEIIEDLKKGM